MLKVKLLKKYFLKFVQALRKRCPDLHTERWSGQSI